MRYLPDITNLLRALETPGQESLAPACTGVAAMINVCVVLFILAHIRMTTSMYWWSMEML